MSDVTPDLSFVTTEAHRRLLEELLDEARRDDEVIGLMVTGSVARGEAYPGSDLDLVALLKDGCTRSFQSEVRDGILVECRHVNRMWARGQLGARPMAVYIYLGGRILYDTDGRLQELVDHAQARYERYRVPPAEKQSLAYCLESVRIKLRAAGDAGDALKASYTAASAAWFILEAIWAVNEKPLPPAGGVLPFFRDLPRRPPEADDWLHRFFAGDAAARVQAAMEAIDWVLPLLESAPLDDTSERYLGDERRFLGRI